MSIHWGGRGPGHLSRWPKAASSGPTVASLLAATDCRPCQSKVTANKQFNSATPHMAVTDIDSLQIAVANWRISTGLTAEDPLGGTATVTAHVEYPVGTSTQLTWNNGDPTVTIASGETAFSDFTPEGLGIPAGEDFWIIIFWNSGTGIFYNPWRNSARGGVHESAASGLTAATLKSEITNFGNNSSPPLMIIAQSAAPAVMTIGDSKTFGFGDTAESASAAGPGLRGEITKSFPTDLAFFNAASNGLRANLWDASNASQRKLLLPYFSHYVINLGHNDLYISSDPAATVQTNIEAITAEILAANANAQITICTQTLKSASSDNWATTGNQTVNSDNADRIAYNDIVRAESIAGQNNGFFEIADQVETARDSGLWKNDGSTANLYTTDGIHETPAGYDLIVTSGAVDPAVFGYVA